MDLAAIRTRLAARLATVDGLFVHATMPLDPPNLLPAATIAPAPGQFLAEVTTDDCADLDLVVTVLLQRASVDSIAQSRLDALVTTIPAAIDSGPTADWDFAVSSPARGYGQYVWGEGDGAVPFLGFEIPVRVGTS